MMLEEKERRENKHQNKNRNPRKVFEQMFKVRLLSEQNEWKLDIKINEICLEQNKKKCLKGSVLCYTSRINYVNRNWKIMFGRMASWKGLKMGKIQIRK